MITAQRVNPTYLAFITLVAALAFPQSAWAASGNVQACTQGQSCTVGEFLYNDSYVPITTATCTLTSRYPNGTLFLNGQAMTGQSDGWYSHEFTAPATNGVYRSQVCCTAGSDYLCLDKTFEIASTALSQSDVAAAVWNATRTSYQAAGSFGQALQSAAPTTTDVATAVWGYSSRTLSSFGTLVANIWSNATRTLTGADLSSGSLATATNVTDATTSIKGASNKDLSQVSTDVAGMKSDTASIKTTVEATQTTVNSIYTDTQALRTDVTSILAKWGTTDAATIRSDIAALSAKLGTSTDADTQSSIFGRIESLRTKWGSQTAQSIYDQAAAAASTINLVRTELAYNGKSTTAYDDMQRIVGYVDTLETLIGSSSDASSATTLFGKVKAVQDKVDLLTSIQTDIDSILDKWGSLKLSDVHDKVKDIKDQLTTVSGATTYSTLINQTITNNTTIVDLKNDLLTMKAVAEANQVLLEQTVNKPIVKTFMLEGSVIFRSLIINPSDKVSQKVPFEYYLPSEVRKEDIIEHDKELTIAYNSEKDQYYLTGEITLAPSETKTVSVRVEDIWKISEETIKSLRKQADELYKPLVNTSYFGQAVTIKSDIDVSLDRVFEMGREATTPEKKLRTYKEAQIELKAAKTKIEKLKELVALASSAGSLAGFVGGAQAIAVWGLIIILVAGFVFLALYMRILRMQEAVPVKTQEKEPAPGKQHGGSRARRALRFAIIFIALSTLSAAVSGLVVYKLVSGTKQAQAVQESKGVLGKKDDAAKIEPQQTEETTIMQEQEPRIQTINVPEGKTVTIRKLPLADAAIVTVIKSSQDIKVLDETTNWVKVDLHLTETGQSAYTVGWVGKEFIATSVDTVKTAENTEKKQSNTLVAGTVVIKDTPTGFLRVREKPGGEEIAQVTPGETFPFLDEENGWVQIKLINGTVGWVAKQYTSLIAVESDSTPGR